MRSAYTNLLIGEEARREQRHYYGRSQPVRVGEEPAGLTEDEEQFIGKRDSFYMATISETGWPYIQHRGGPEGFLKVLGPTTLAFADFGGNRQMISTAAVNTHGKVSLFLMDYVARERLKIIGTARVVDAKDADPELKDVGTPGIRAERYFVIEVQGYDWNCPKYITPRYTAEQVEVVVGGLKDRILELEAKLAAAS